MIWVYNCNEVKIGVDAYDTYFPGHDVVDVLATDVYTEDFNRRNYEELLKLAGSKPIALGEVGELPTLEKLKDQPRWVWFMAWAEPGSTRAATQRSYRDIYENEVTLTHKELPWVKVKNPRVHSPVLKE